MQIDLSLAISLVAIMVSLVDFYYQRFRVRGAKIDVLNTNDTQRSVPRTYSGLPQNVQTKFPDYPDAAPGYILAKVVFGNAGDRAGIANIQRVRAMIKNNPHEIIKASYYSYTLIPAYDIVEHEILLRNIQISTNPMELEVELTIECGGYNPRNSQYLRQSILQKTLKISLAPGDENPWTSF